MVTGASSGIGRSLALRLGRRGDPVALVARRELRLNEVAAAITAGGGEALVLPCDVTDAAQMDAAVRAAEARLGPMERFVSSAGGGGRASIDEFRADEVAALLALNVVGLARGIEAVLPGMLARNAGHLVVIGSLAASRGLPVAAAYGAAKAAVRNMMESLRIDLRGRGVDVTLIEPGPVRARAKSKKSRLASIDLEDATARMERVIDARKSYAAFPPLVVLASRLGALLPAPLYDRLLAGRVRKHAR
jgi:NADP-dependent 3-hydroxy acid dehydrogenase YdfG